MTVSQDSDPIRENGGASPHSGKGLTATHRLVAMALVVAVVIVVVVVTRSAGAVGGVIGSMALLLIWLSTGGIGGGSPPRS